MKKHSFLMINDHVQKVKLKIFYENNPVNFDKLNIYSINNLLKNYEEPDEHMKIYMRRLKEIERISVLKRNEMENIKMREMLRINKEFLMFDYERRFNVKKLKLLTALVGIENAHVEFGKQNKEQREFFHKKSICRTFNFIEIGENILSMSASKRNDFKLPKIPSNPIIDIYNDNEKERYESNGV